MKKNLSAGLKALLIGALLCLTAQGAVEAQSRSQTASVGAVAAPSVQPPVDYQLAAGDTIHILVFQNPDMTLDTRVSEDGDITYPLIGSIKVGGLTIAAAESAIGQALKRGGFVRDPQINISLNAIVGNSVSVLGFVNKPGSYPLLTVGTRLTQMLSDAGGVSQLGSNQVIVTGTRDGHPFYRKVDVNSIFLDGHAEDDITLAGGDDVFVPKAQMFYIYGEVNKPGEYPVERNMTVMQALAAGGGPTTRGSEDRIKLSRRDDTGHLVKGAPQLSDAVKPDDVIYVNESFF
jgi:polysaccharide export outer membrane protein